MKIKEEQFSLLIILNIGDSFFCGNIHNLLLFKIAPRKMLLTNMSP